MSWRIMSLVLNLKLKLPTPTKKKKKELTTWKEKMFIFYL